MKNMTVQTFGDAGDDSVALPQRSGAPDCLYYVRTGRCDYGINCRFNHPQKRMLDETCQRRDEYPERLGEPECQYYLKTGTCRFGSACRYHHPKEKSGIVGKTIVNSVGYPLRLGEKDCAYYMQTGTCKFGTLCKFNHPQPSCLGGMEAGTGSPSAFPSCSVAREPYMQGLLLHSSCYAPFPGLPAGLVSMPGWTAYQTRPAVPLPALNLKHSTFGTTAIYGAAPTSIHGSYSPCMAISASTNLVPLNNLSKNSKFPERPGQPECKYYIKTGDCKFGASCHFDHPKRWILPLPDCDPSYQVLPKRPGTQPCTYYMQYGICKFGISCRFDHPTTSLTYSPFSKPFLNHHIFPYSQSLAFPRFLHSSINTLGGPNVQQCNTDNGMALLDGQALTKQASGELKDGLNGGSR